MPASDNRPVAVKLDLLLRERQKRLADTKHDTPDWLMRVTVEQCVEREERRELFRQDGIRAWEAYLASGRHVTHVQVDAWLAQLEAGSDVEPPECHD